MHYVNVNILSGDDSAASVTGSKVDSNQLISASFSTYFGDATAVGTMKIQASNDPCPQGYLPDTFTPTHWVDVPSATAAVTAGGPVIISINQMAYRWVRAVYTRTSGGSTTVKVDMFALSV